VTSIEQPSCEAIRNNRARARARARARILSRIADRCVEISPGKSDTTLEIIADFFLPFLSRRLNILGAGRSLTTGRKKKKEEEEKKRKTRREIHAREISESERALAAREGHYFPPPRPPRQWECRRCLAGHAGRIQQPRFDICSSGLGQEI